MMLYLPKWTFFQFSNVQLGSFFLKGATPNQYEYGKIIGDMEKRFFLHSTADKKAQWRNLI
jgi:hypothetical protein